MDGWGMELSESWVGRSIISVEWSDLRRGEGKRKGRERLRHPSFTACGVKPKPTWQQMEPLQSAQPPSCLSFSECACLLPATTVRSVATDFFLFHWLLEWFFNDMLIEKATELTVEQNWSMITSTTRLASTEYNSVRLSYAKEQCFFVVTNQRPCLFSEANRANKGTISVCQHVFCLFTFKGMPICHAT